MQEDGKERTVLSDRSLQSDLSRLRGKRVLITGGAGFVGSRTVQRLLELGSDVTVLDDFFTGREENLPRAEVRIIRGSVTDETLVEGAVAGAEFVLHMADRNINVARKKPAQSFSTTYGGTVSALRRGGT